MSQIRVKCGIKIFWGFSGALTNFSGSELSEITSLSAFKSNPGQVALRITFLFDFIIIYAKKRKYFTRGDRENENHQFGILSRYKVEFSELALDRSNGIRIIVHVAQDSCRRSYFFVIRVINHL